MDENNSGTPNAEGQQAEQQQQSSNQSQPYAIFPDAASFQKRIEREAGKLQKELAKELGFDSVETMRAALKPKEEKPKTEQPNEVDRFKLMLNVGAEFNLPAAVISRLQGATLEELRADAERLQALFQSNQQQQPKQGIPSAPAGKTPSVTFTKDQLKDAAFVRANQAAILQAAREGRIQ